ncbi:MAG: hypothetical protein Tsb0034_12650 [Ekhidna sp.]
MKTLYLSLLAGMIFSCGSKPEMTEQEARAQVLQLHHAQRDYHFNKDSIAFAGQMSENFISINRGEITTPTREATISRYNGYFSSVEFVSWDDVTEPVIRFSDDLSLAYTVVDKVVRVKYQDENGVEQEGETHFAWTAIYRRKGENWKLECVTSTNQPDE